MRNVLSISLPQAVLKDLKSESKKEKASVSEVVRKALKDYFFRSEFERARKKVKMESAKKGIHFTETEILEKIS
jgi:predicted transcriptional regulator